MTPIQYKKALSKLGLTIVGAAPLLGISRRQSQRIAATGPVPALVGKVLDLLVEGKIQKEDLGWS